MAIEDILKKFELKLHQKKLEHTKQAIDDPEREEDEKLWQNTKKQLASYMEKALKKLPEKRFLWIIKKDMPTSNIWYGRKHIDWTYNPDAENWTPYKEIDSNITGR